ncbi:transcriptional regulator family: Fungal Specific TF [Penicillium coprophilum]|uniref:transcriptional regulator family: Fungal Specific TF n=1 Tax=Penicillium coprophilum TaxID=36646 RepID=UPI00238C2CBF|nr:transcriptional regulator family: Fungal Specific TF [Penicillium coprophilum]KAJ5170553.1 transcriptional regulator family: Fungal Specific TF [Penicillium coprophilum]
MHGHVPLSRKKAKTGCKTCNLSTLCINRPCLRWLWHLGGGGSPYGQPNGNRDLSTYCTPVPVGNLSHEEQLCFDWLIKRTAKKFAGLFPSDFWETLIFQASAQEPAVRHAVIAVSSTHRFQHQSTTTLTKYDEECFTLRQYNKAIQHLRTNVTNNRYSLRVALITCMLFITLEYMRGQYQMAGAHLQYGMKLLSDISAPRPPSSMMPTTLSPDEDFAYNALVDAYVRLGIQAAMFGHVASHMYIVTKDPLSTRLPYTFSSLLEARRSLDDLLNRIHCLEKHYRDHHAPQAPTNKQQMLNTQSRILADLSRWGKTYTVTVARLRTSKISGKDQMGYLLLRVYHEMAEIMASVCLSPEGTESELIFDSYTDNFIKIMTSFLDIWRIWSSTVFRKEDISKLDNAPEDLKAIFQNFKTMSDLNVILEASLLELLEKAPTLNQYLKSPDCVANGFTVEMGYIPPIYYTALKCRVPRLRRQAVRALRAAPHREGLWNGSLLADVLEEIIKVEEGDFYADNMSVHSSVGHILPKHEELLVPKVPAEARVSDVKILLPDDISGHTYVSYRRKVLGGEWMTFTRKISV